MPGKNASSLLNRLANLGAMFALIGLAIVALLSGSDRQSREFPNSPSLTGWPYDTGASRAKAILAYVQAGPRRALDPARRSVLSDPLSVQALSILGRSQFYSGQLAKARKTFEVAGQLGWRDPLTQIYWLDQALEAGDFRVAAERLDALLRQSPAHENMDKFLAILSATPEGRTAIAQRLKLQPNWARRYIGGLRDISDQEVMQRVDVMNQTGRGIWTCPSTTQLAQRLIDAKLLVEAQSVWRLNCATSSSLVYDGEFDWIDTTKPTAAFDWQLSNRGDIDIALIQDAKGNRLLSTKVTAAISLPAIRQLIVLKPGRYRLKWSTPETPESQARTVQVSLSCKVALSEAQAGLPDPSRPGRHLLDFDVPSQCPAQQLVFWLAPGSQVNIDTVSLEAI